MCIYNKVNWISTNLIYELGPANSRHLYFTWNSVQQETFFKDSEHRLILTIFILSVPSMIQIMPTLYDKMLLLGYSMLEITQELTWTGFFTEQFPEDDSSCITIKSKSWVLVLGEEDSGNRNDIIGWRVEDTDTNMRKKKKVKQMPLLN